MALYNFWAFGAKPSTVDVEHLDAQPYPIGDVEVLVDAAGNPTGLLYGGRRYRVEEE